MLDIINTLFDHEKLDAIFTIVIAILYLTGRITKGQFIAEQSKAKGIIRGTSDEIKSSAKQLAINSALTPLTAVFDVLDAIPVVNSKLPVINQSVPGMGKSIIQTVVGAPIGLISDILINIPFVGSKVK